MIEGSHTPRAQSQIAKHARPQISRGFGQHAVAGDDGAYHRHGDKRARPGIRWRAFSAPGDGVFDPGIRQRAASSGAFSLLHLALAAHPRWGSAHHGSHRKRSCCEQWAARRLSRQYGQGRPRRCRCRCRPGKGWRCKVCLWRARRGDKGGNDDRGRPSQEDS
jgi:hypothetical protein